jgi:UDP-N-acetyl-2-amino-2-deoxyglucuronate dehydrogenase
MPQKSEMLPQKGCDHPLKAGVVGCGRISEKHLSALASEYVRAKIVAVADIDESKARAKGETYGVPHYLDYHDMLRAHPDIDVIDVLTPTGFHAEHVIDLAPYGKNIVVEKPMALRVEDCDAMIEACRHHGCRLFVIKQNRFNRAVLAARAAMDEGRFGKMVLGTVRVRWCRDQHYYDQAEWRGTWALDGGVMSQQASHHLDLLHWFMGPVESLQCQTATRIMDIEVEDTGVAIMRFRSGALGVFEATVASRPEDLEGSLSLMGDKGSVILGGPAVNRIEYWRFVAEKPMDKDIQEQFSQDVPNVYGHGHTPYLAHVVDAILENKPGLVEGEEGKKTIEILTALYESAALGGAPVTPGQKVCHTPIGTRSLPLSAHHQGACTRK